MQKIKRQFTRQSEHTLFLSLYNNNNYCELIEIYSEVSLSFCLFLSYDGEDLELRALHFRRLERRLLLSAILLAIFQPDIFGRFQASTKYFTKNRTYIIDSKMIVSYLQFYKKILLELNLY